MLKQIKHQFMAFRNGIVADTLRKAGDPHGIIFGLQLPQIAQISRELPKDAALARELWADSNVRESRLLACRVFPPEQITLEEAIALAQEVRSREEADILVFYLLRHTQLMAEIKDALLAQNGEKMKWIIEAIQRNIRE